MKATTLKKKYPELWYLIENDIIESMLTGSIMSGMDIQQQRDDPKHSRINIIAHNATFLAISNFIEYMKPVKIPSNEANS